MLDLLVTNATIHTMDQSRPSAGAIGIIGDRIVAVGDELDGSSAKKVLDASGLTMLPGFNDAHCHTTWFGLSLTEVDLIGCRSLDEVYSAIARRVADSADGEWVVATGFNHFSFGGRYPDIAVLDRIAPHHPLYIRHNSGHACIVNTAALRLAGFLASDREETEGAVAVRAADGSLTGLLEEQAQLQVQKLFLPYSQAGIVDAIERATLVYAKEGITSFTEAGIAGGWIGHSPVELAAYHEALETDRLWARAQLMVVLDALHELTGHADDDITFGLDLGLRTGFGDDRLSIGPAKVFLDGSLLGLTAAVHEPYCVGAAGNRGYFQGDEETVRKRVLDAYASGWSIAAHAIGDRTIDLAIDILGEAQERHGIRPVPNRIEHGGVISNHQLESIAELGVVVVPQPGFIPAFGMDMANALGPDRTFESYRAASLLASGLPLPGSSDRPVAPGGVLGNVRAFVDRKCEDGKIYGPDERITVQQALHAYTVGSAQATGSSGNRGRLRPGMLADFVMLDADPLQTKVEDLTSINVVATALGGRFTHTLV